MVFSFHQINQRNLTLVGTINYLSSYLRSFHSRLPIRILKLTELASFLGKQFVVFLKLASGAPYYSKIHSYYNNFTGSISNAMDTARESRNDFDCFSFPFLEVGSQITKLLILQQYLNLVFHESLLN